MILRLCLLLLLGCGKPITEGREKNQNTFQDLYTESLFGNETSLNFDLLPLSGQVDRRDKFWTGDSWRSQRGSINYRWNSPDSQKEELSPSRKAVFLMTDEERRQLSPAEKYDLYLGRYDFPLKQEVDWFKSFASESWEGLCHGWAGASMNHPEPHPIHVTNEDGLEIAFGSSDLKALLSYAYAKILIDEDESLGKRCEEKSDHCDDDLSPVTFHALLANEIGLRGNGIIADIERYKEVWNHPLFAYESKILSMRKTSHGRRAVIQTLVYYTEINEKNSWWPTNASPLQMTGKASYTYRIDLDESGNMKEGVWLSRERPDFVWKVKKAKNFEGHLEKLTELLK
jgi:hypothetical protein